MQIDSSLGHDMTRGSDAKAKAKPRSKKQTHKEMNNDNKTTQT